MCADRIWGQGGTEDPVSTQEGKGHPCTKRLRGCSVRPGVTYKWVWRCSPTAAPQHSPGDKPCAHGWAAHTLLTLLCTAQAPLQGVAQDTRHPALHPPAHLSNPGNGAHRSEGTKRGTGTHQQQGTLPSMRLYPQGGYSHRWEN